ncbi:type II secretion system protein [bacterium]|nr:type II secretion system protein [bacterium]
MKKLAFTLTELMVALGVIGIVAAVLIPVIFNFMPDQNILMAKRAYYTTQEVVSDLINDDNCYPDKSTLSGTDAKVGFDFKSVDPGAVCSGAVTTSADAKFIALFKSRLDLKSSGTPFITKDGMEWTFTTGTGKNTFDCSETDKTTCYLTLKVDVNGSDSKPNCGDSCSDGRKKGFDVFTMKIYADGDIDINDNWAKAAVHVGKDITGNDVDEDEDEE